MIKITGFTIVCVAIIIFSVFAKLPGLTAAAFLWLILRHEHDGKK